MKDRMTEGWLPDATSKRRKGFPKKTGTIDARFFFMQYQ